MRQYKWHIIEVIAALFIFGFMWLTTTWWCALGTAILAWIFFQATVIK